MTDERNVTSNDLKRRRLSFSCLGEVIPEVERLLAGHVVVGRWPLSLMCHHLRMGIELSIDGFPARAPWIVRRTVGPVAGWFSLWLGWIPRGMPVPGWRVPAAEMDAVREMEGLRCAIERFESFEGRLDEHPVLGRFSRRKWERFHCIHCAHHLSFAVAAT